MNNLPPFDAHDVFGDDYLYFYEDMLTPERTAREADAIWKLLALAPGHAVLDLGCGHGRIANALAQRGARVTGLDASQHFLSVARRDAAAAGVAVDFVEGDMRALSWQGVFDAALLWFTTFGYFGDDDNERVVREAAKALKPGGRFLIEQINRNALLRRGLPASHVVRRGDDMMVDLVDYDGLTDRSLTERIVVRGGKVKRAKYFVRLYSSCGADGARHALRLPVGRHPWPGRRAVHALWQPGVGGGFPVRGKACCSAPPGDPPRDALDAMIPTR